MPMYLSGPSPPHSPVHPLSMPKSPSCPRHARALLPMPMPCLCLCPPLIHAYATTAPCPCLCLFPSHAHVYISPLPCPCLCTPLAHVYSTIVAMPMSVFSPAHEPQGCSHPVPLSRIRSRVRAVPTPLGWAAACAPVIPAGSAGSCLLFM